VNTTDQTPPGDAPRPEIDIGVILAGRLPERQRRIATAATTLLQRELAVRFRHFRFNVPTLRQRDIAESGREESSRLLRQAADVRTLQRWDYAVLVTGDELIARRRSYAFAALSRPLDAAIVSTARVIPLIDAGAQPDEGPSESILVDRLATLMLHAIAHLGGLGESGERNGLLFHPESAADLDDMQDFDAAELAALDAAFVGIADTRLEESAVAPGPRWRFTLRAAWINREQIRDAVVAARPWEFPQRLSRLTAAAVSILAVLILTAEVWDLGLSLSWSRNIVMAALVLIATTAFVVARQQLLMRRFRERREQLVVTRVSAVLIVLCGLLVTWFGIFCLALLAGATLFGGELVAEWAASTGVQAEAVGAGVFLKMAMFLASIGLLIGSLGASFEDQQHFQHVIFVDEEL